MINIRKKILALGLIVLLVVLCGTVLSEATTTGNENKPLRNLEFINVDLRQVFRSLAATGRFNVILGQTVKGNVSIAFKSGITAQEAVAVIAKNYGYQHQWQPDSKAVIIGDIKSLAGNLNSKTMVDIPLQYIDAAAAVSSLEIVIPRERIKPDSSGRKLIVFGNSLELQNVNEIITKIDRSLASINVEVKVAEVTDDFWKTLGMDRKGIRSHIGIYPVSARQVNELSDRDLIHSLARRNLTLYDNQEGKLFFGDKFQKTSEKDRSHVGARSSSTEVIDTGTTIQITSWVGEGNNITLQVRETTLIAALTLTTASKNEADFLPNFDSREVTSIISTESGQTFILTGMIGRDEFNRLKQIPGNYPVLNALFSAENSLTMTQKTSTQVIAMITPVFLEDSSKQNADSANALAKPIDPNNVDDSVAMVEYLVKKSDTITGIGIRFNVEPKTIIAANQWDNQNMVIKVDSWILIPVPKERIYEIKPKETLWRIAKRYGTTVELLQDLNNIVDIEKVKAGQKIVLPVAISQIKAPRF